MASTNTGKDIYAYFTSERVCLQGGQGRVCYWKQNSASHLCFFREYVSLAYKVCWKLLVNTGNNPRAYYLEWKYTAKCRCQTNSKTRHKKHLENKNTNRM